MRCGVVENLTEVGDFSAEFDLCNPAIDGVFQNTGNFLEYYTRYQMYEQCFDDVVNGYSFFRGNDTDNELDVLATKGPRLMPVSCKMTGIRGRGNPDGESESCIYNLYEIRTLANRANSIGTTIPVLNPNQDARKLLDGHQLDSTLYSLITRSR